MAAAACILPSLKLREESEYSTESLTELIHFIWLYTVTTRVYHNLIVTIDICMFYLLILLQKKRYGNKLSTACLHRVLRHVRKLQLHIQGLTRITATFRCFKAQFCQELFGLIQSTSLYDLYYCNAHLYWISVGMKKIYRCYYGWLFHYAQ